MNYIFVVLITFVLTSLLFWWIGNSYKNMLLKKGKYRGTVWVKDERLVIVKQDYYHELLFRPLETLTPELRRVLTDVVRERERQDLIYPEPPESIEELMVVLMEEIGEFAQAVQAEKAWSKSTDSDNSYEEIIQSAAVCAKIAEFIIKRDSL